MPLTRQAIDEVVDSVMTPGAHPETDPGATLALLGPEVYQIVARQSSVAMFLVAPDGRFVAVNPAACSLFDRSEPELLTCTLGDVSHPDDDVWSRQLLKEALAHGTPSYRISKRYLRGDGSAFVADVSVSLLLGRDSVPLGFFASAIDDTERLETARRADAAAALLRDSMDSLLDPWVLMRPVRDAEGAVADFVYLEANREACRHNGVSQDDLVGARLLDLLPGHREELLASYARVVDTGEPLILDDYPFETDGEVRWFDNRAVRVGEGDLSFTWRDVSEAHKQRNELTRQAFTDPLTGLYNRAGLDEAVRRLAGPERRTSGGLAALYLDLDGLASINNVYGHPAGDAVIRAVGDRVAGALRGSDVVARVGGDEFVVLAPGVDDDKASQLAIKIAQAVTRPVRFEGASIVPTISVGVCVGTGESDVGDLIARADDALLARKRRLYASRGLDASHPG